LRSGKIRSADFATSFRWSKNRTGKSRGKNKKKRRRRRGNRHARTVPLPSPKAACSNWLSSNWQVQAIPSEPIRQACGVQTCAAACNVKVGYAIGALALCIVS